MASLNLYGRVSVLANALVNTVSNELKRAHFQPKNLENLNVQFSFIKTDTTLSGKKDVLLKLIDDID